MKYEELKYEEINIEDVEIIRYSQTKNSKKWDYVDYTSFDIEKVIFNGNVYLRNGEEIDIDWLGDQLETYHYFYDKVSDERIKLVSFRNEKGEMCYGFSDHND